MNDQNLPRVSAPHPTPLPAAGSPGAADNAPATPWRVWAMTVWHPQLAAAVAPVGVLAVEGGASDPEVVYATWVPGVYEEADSWRIRLAEAPVSAAVLDQWAQDDSTLGLLPADVPPQAVDLAHAAELVLDEILAGDLLATGAGGV